MSDGRKRPRTEEEKRIISERTKLAMQNPEIRNKVSSGRKGKPSWNKGKKTGPNPHGTKRNFVSSREQGLFYEYGIMLSDYNKIFEEQNGRCLGCGKHQTELSHPLHVDHDHKTGKIRGLLCKKCNSALGNADDNIGILQGLIEYLKRRL